jgi:hypothetical protein
MAVVHGRAGQASADEQPCHDQGEEHAERCGWTHAPGRRVPGTLSELSPLDMYGVEDMLVRTIGHGGDPLKRD